MHVTFYELFKAYIYFDIIFGINGILINALSH